MGEDDDRRAALERIEALSLSIAVRSIPRMLEPLQSGSLSLQQLKVLSVVVTTEEGASIAQLAGSFGVTMASMSNLVDRLVAGGFAERAADARDLRIRRVHSTDLGRAVVQRMMGARPELGADVLSQLSLDELRALETGLGAVGRVLRDGA
ncbi:MarR family winged helix-turn-helix transcriptional regulator [Microbacterium sp. ZW T2_14]|uniref:MarR family winged helix-turn-helix transcriptional regulator n=1 Tax=Microbacterium sp. ZW T2_14 TaxID=3378079 RepID=UPI003855555D